MPAVQLRITGIVQGVGYRYALEREARRLGLTGWVRNRADGSVEAVAQGPQPALDQLSAWARRGPPAARVAEVLASPAPAEETTPLQRFEIRPSA
jgi:acylphosphatase